MAVDKLSRVDEAVARRGQPEDTPESCTAPRPAGSYGPPSVTITSIAGQQRPMGGWPGPDGLPVAVTQGFSVQGTCELDAGVLGIVQCEVWDVATNSVSYSQTSGVVSSTQTQWTCTGLTPPLTPANHVAALAARLIQSGTSRILASYGPVPVRVS